MSILQEYKEYRKIIGEEIYDAIEIYLDKVSPPENVDKYFKELNALSYDSDIWVEKLKEIKQKYNVKFLSDIICNEEGWKKFDTWYKADFKYKNVKLLKAWKSDFGDMRCNALLYKNNRLIANIVESFNIDHFYLVEKNMFNIEKKMKSYIYNNFNKYVYLPKITKSSKLMKEIYDIVCNSDSSMCYITDEDWKENYSDRFSEKDIAKLKEEVRKYKLDNIITFDDGEYKILGYGDLAKSFNDDREINKERTSAERKRVENKYLKNTNKKYERSR